MQPTNLSTCNILIGIHVVPYWLIFAILYSSGKAINGTIVRLSDGAPPRLSAAEQFQLRANLV
jgi:hypothetical protein